MTRDETASILGTLRLSYPSFYSKMSRGDMAGVLNLWSTIFADDDYKVVQIAVCDLITNHKGFPPEIADVKQKIREIYDSVGGGASDEELWQMLVNAVANGTYGATEEFEKLPPVLQRYCGSPSWIRDHAKMDEQTFSSVVHGQFLKVINIMREREEFSNRLPQGVKDYIVASTHRLDALESGEARDGNII